MKKSVRKMAPWFLAALIFFFLFRKIPPGEVLETLRFLHVPLFVFLTTGYFALLLLIDSWGLQYILTRFAASFRFGETVLMRGATYLLMLINYGLGQGGIAVYAKRAHQAPVFKTLGCVFHLSLTDMLLLLVCGGVASAFGNLVYRGVSLRMSLGSLALVAWFLFVGMILFWRFFESPLVLCLRRLRPIDWILRHDVFHVYREASIRDYLSVFLLRVPMVAIAVFSPWLALAVFDVFLPVSVVLTYLPILLIAGSLPITPSGLGTIQILAVEFFTPYVVLPEKAVGIVTVETLVLASSLLWIFSNLLLKALFGLFCLGKKSKKLFEAVD